MIFIEKGPTYLKMKHSGFAYWISLSSILNVLLCRQYEERELRDQQERAKKRLEFDNQKQRLVNQLEYEKSQETYSKFFNY